MATQRTTPLREERIVCARFLTQVKATTRVPSVAMGETRGRNSLHRRAELIKGVGVRLAAETLVFLVRT